MHGASVDPNACLPDNFIGSTGLGPCHINIPDELSLNNSLNEILCYGRKQRASDIHLSVNNPITIRRFSRLLAATHDVLTADHIRTLVRKDVPENKLKIFEEKGDLEYVHTIEGAGRFRLCLMKQRFGWDVAVRIIPLEITPIEKSGMPEACKKLTQWAQGLVLVTGPAGCGKTTTLATLVDMINRTRDEHIITIENPIEVVFNPAQCQITQREVNLHTLSQLNALRGALREDPDIIVVSELRDLESIRLAISAAETGHLVFGTMNTKNAVQTLSGLVNSFPSDEQMIVTNMISESLRGVISQQLVPTADGNGVIPCYELLVVNHSVANLMREKKFDQINNTMATGKADGMVLLDNALKDLIKQQIITLDEAKKRAINPKSLELVV